MESVCLSAVAVGGDGATYSGASCLNYSRGTPALLNRHAIEVYVPNPHITFLSLPPA